MKEMIESILQAEQEAREKIEQAKKEASRIQAESDREIARQKDELKKEVRARISEAVEQARSEAASQKTDPVPETLEGLLSELDVPRKKYDEVVRRVKEMLIHPDLT